MCLKLYCENCEKKTVHVANADAYDEDLVQADEFSLIEVQLEIRIICAMCARVHTRSSDESVLIIMPG